MRHPAHLLRARLAGAAAACGLALAGLVVAAAPASAAACSGTSGVTVVVDTGSSISTRCASGNPSSAIEALTTVGFEVDYPQQFPGSVVCRINGYPASDPCVRMPPGDAYWAFFHADRGGSWVYSSNGAGSHDPAAGSAVAFRFGSGQQPRVAPPAPPKTSAPVPTKTTARPEPTSTTSTQRGRTPGTTTAPSGTGATAGSSSTPASPTATATPLATGTASASPTATETAPTRPSPSASDIAAAPTSADAGGGSAGTLIAGGALVALVAGGAAWAAWKRRV